LKQQLEAKLKEKEQQITALEKSHKKVMTTPNDMWLLITETLTHLFVMKTTRL